MRITPDTNILLRAAIAVEDPASDDGRQALAAIALLKNADLVAVTLPALCEFVWVLRRLYKHSVADIGQAIRSLCSGPAIVCERQAIEEGLRILESGGDFADGIIAWSGKQMGGNIFYSFDRSAVQKIRRAGGRAANPDSAVAPPD